MSIRVNGKVIASNGDVKTETDNLVTTDTNQTITANKNFTGTVTVTTQPNTDSSTKVATTEYVKNVLDEASPTNMVTIDTDQTITAKKIFTAEQQKKSTVIDVTTQPENYTANNAVRFLDKNDQITGYIENGQMASGEITTGIHAKNKDGYQPHVSIFAPLSGTTGAYAIAPITPNGAPVDAITTKGYVENNYVDKTSTQTISGSKRFTQPPEGMSIELVADTNQQTVPATARRREICLYRNATYTKGDGFTSWIRGSRDSNGWTRTELLVRRFLEEDSQEILNYLKVNIRADGIPVSTTKTPPTDSTGEEITTAGWFRQSNCNVRTVIETYHNGTSWYRIWSDGWKEQGGRVDVKNDGTVTVTFLKPFSNTNYYANWISCAGIALGGSGTRAADNLTTTTMRLNNGQDVTMTANWFACGY